jgi:YjbR
VTGLERACRLPVAHASLELMPVTPTRAKKLALSFEGASERPHFDRTALRTPRKTFATLAGNGADINLMFDPELRDFFCEQSPQAFSPVPGGWGRMGATRCDLKKVDEATLLSALKAAHALAAPTPKKRARKPPSSA